jgi:hypothetical protein
MRWLCKSGFRESESPVTDHTIFVTSGIARVTQVKQVWRQAVTSRCQYQAIDRCAAASLFVGQWRLQV